jgi:hypothetical protein
VTCGLAVGAVGDADAVVNEHRRAERKSGLNFFRRLTFGDEVWYLKGSEFCVAELGRVHANFARSEDVGDHHTAK